MTRDLRPMYSYRPARDHCAERVPPVCENQNHMGYGENDVDPHKPEMPNARRIEPTKGRSQQMELHGLVNRPSCSDGKATGERNSEVRLTLERVVLCVETRMRPWVAR